jgi:hypothetical protein
VTSRPAAAQHLRDIARLRRVRDPDRPGVRAAVGRRGVRPAARRCQLGTSAVSSGAAYGESPVCLSDHAAHRARDGAASSWRPQRHRALLRGRLLTAGHLAVAGEVLAEDPARTSPRPSRTAAVVVREVEVREPELERVADDLARPLERAVPPKLCQRPREISDSFSPHLPTRRYCIAAPNPL